MRELAVPYINSCMRNALATRIEEDQIAYPQILRLNLGAFLRLRLRGSRQLDIILTENMKNKARTIKSTCRCSSI